MFINVLTYTLLETAKLFGFVGKQGNKCVVFELLAEFLNSANNSPIELHSKAIEIVSVFSSILPHYCGLNLPDSCVYVMLCHYCEENTNINFDRNHVRLL